MTVLGLQLAQPPAWSPSRLGARAEAAGVSAQPRGCPVQAEGCGLEETSEDRRVVSRGGAAASVRGDQAVCGVIKLLPRLRFACCQS